MPRLFAWIAFGGSLLALLMTSSPSSVARPSTTRAVHSLTPNLHEQPQPDVIERRRSHGTRLRRTGSAPDLYVDPAPGPDVHLIHYPAPVGALKAWLLEPDTDTLRGPKGYPALVYAHDGWSVSAAEIAHAELFRRAGLLVLVPAWRGENGNIGNYEHLFGEVDDLVAAVHFAAELPLVDRERLSVFGHGLGGMLSAMAALVETLPAGETASSAGLLGERAFENVDLPFYDSPYERELRWVGPHVEHLRLPHFACVGQDDQEAYAIARALSLRAQRSGTPLRVNAPRDRGLGSRHACEGLYLRRLVQRFALPAPH